MCNVFNVEAMQYALNGAPQASKCWMSAIQNKLELNLNKKDPLGPILFLKSVQSWQQVSIDTKMHWNLYFVSPTMSWSQFV